MIKADKAGRDVIDGLLDVVKKFVSLDSLKDIVEIRDTIEDLDSE
jgi:hypothetical protein